MRFYNYFLILLVPIWFSSCKVFRSNLMLKTAPDYTYDKIVDSLSEQNYRIAPNDLVQVRIFTNTGFKIIDQTNSNTSVIKTDFDYIVERDGKAKLPIVGYVKLAGLTVKEAEVFLEQVYNAYYVNTFINVKIVNKRVIVFPGNGGLAKVLPLTNSNTTVIEALALTGGISEDGKAYKVKLIRNEINQKPKVYLMDLSKIEGLAAGNTVVLANDIIYVEPRYRLARTIASEITPIISVLTSALIVYSLFIKK